MNDELLKYYNRELAYIRHSGKVFAEQYPKVAGRLKLTDEQIEDPHVSRLIESFAFLTANIRQKLDDSFPELTDALLGQLYPDYQAPIPSMSVIKLEAENLSTTGVIIPKGAEVETNVENMKQCQFQTAYDAHLWPVEITDVKFENAPFVAPKPQFSTNPKSVLKLEITGEYKGVPLTETEIDNLHVYINGQWHQTLNVYELLFKNCLGIAIEHPCGKVHFLSHDQIETVGFSENEALVPYSQRTSSGFRLLVENFVFPEKFSFFNVSNIARFLPNDANQCHFYFYFDESANELVKQANNDLFLLGCTPIINLFEQELEPIRPKASQYEYKLEPRYMDAEISEVISLQEVIAYDEKSNKQLVTPFYGQTHPKYSDASSLFWHLRRESSQWAGGYAEAGTQSFISLVDAQFENNHYTQDSALLTTRALCSNRNLPASMPFGDEELGLFMPSRGDVIKKIRCLVSPTQTVRPQLSDATRWQLVSHLSLDSFSGENAHTKLQELLRLYDFKASPQSKGLIENIHSVTITPSTARVAQNGRIGFAAGNDITITFSKDDYSGSGIFYFSSVLNRFFAQFAAINSFTRLAIKMKGQDELYHQWPAQIGEVPLV